MVGIDSFFFLNNRERFFSANRHVGKTNRMTNRMGLFPQSHATFPLRNRLRTTKYGVGLKTACLNASASKAWKTSINDIKLSVNRHRTTNVNSHPRVGHSRGPGRRCGVHSQIPPLFLSSAPPYFPELAQVWPGVWMPAAMHSLDRTIIIR